MTRRSTQDRAAPGVGPPQGVGGMHSVEQIGPKRHRTKEGYLICEDVPIARTGWMQYGRGETPVKTNALGFALINRDAETLFNPVTMMSFVGKPVTNDHPYGGVSPSNWKLVSVGSVLNVRQGKGADSDTMRADLLITDARAIVDVESGKREVSAGYEADYQITGDGEGRQVHIIGNHVALVTRGRCGPRCAIGDKAPTILISKGKTMPQRTPTARRQVSDAQRAAIMSLVGDPDETGDEDEDGEDAGHVHVHLHNGGAAAKTGDAATMDAAVDDRFSSLETAVGELTKAVTKLITSDASAGIGAKANAEEEEEEGEAEEDGNGKKGVKKVENGESKTADSAALATSYTALMADAEVLVPGFKVPTFDAALDRKSTVDKMCGIRRKAIDQCGITADGAILLTTIAGKTVDTLTMDCKQVATLFRTAAAAKKLANNAGSTAGASRVAVSDAAAAKAAHDALPLEKRGPSSIAELQALNRMAFPEGSVTIKSL